MCIKAVDNYPFTIKYVRDRYKTQEMCLRAANICSFVFDSATDRYKTQEMCNKAVDDNPNALEFASD